jgi:hypothetical protein
VRPRSLVLVLFVLVAPAVAAGNASFAKALAAARATDNVGDYCSDDARDPKSVVCRAIKDDAQAERAAAAIAREVSVSRASASAIGEAMLPVLGYDIDGQLTPGEYDTANATLRAALQAETNQTPIIAALAQLAAAHGRAADDYRALLPLIHAQPAPVHTAIEAVNAAGDDESIAVLLGDAYTRDRDNYEVIDALGSANYDSLLRAAFGPIALTGQGAAMRKRQASLTAAALGDRATTQITAMAALGLPETVVAAFRALPPEVVDHLVAAAPTESDVRLDIAAAAILTGKLDLARQLSSAISMTPKANEDAEAGTRHIIETALSDQKNEKLFDLIIENFSSSFSALSGVRAHLFASVLEKHGYPGLAAEILTEARFHPTADSIVAELAEPLQEMVGRVDAVNAAADARIALLVRAKPLVSTSSRIAAPRIVPFTERPLPKLSGAPSGTAVIDCSDAAKVAATTNLPSYVHPIRMERNGNEVVAVTISSAVDPAGEVALGGYWILRSRDAGHTWSEYYTGLRQNLPYVVPPASRLPLIDGDRLRLEVEVQELDTASITFPPVAMRLARSQKDLYLDIPWDELTRDSDSDGLTDLLEERIVTDPHDADTDGDAIPDREDGLPQVAFGGSITVENEILATVLEGFSLGGGRIVLGVGGSDDAAANSCEIRTSAIDEGVLFLVGDRTAFAPLTMNGRAVVLTNDELAAYTTKFGPIYPAQIRHFVVEHGGRRAMIELNQTWAGSTLLLTKTEQGWQITEISGWIT